MKVVLYTTGCPKCKMLKKLLEQKAIPYTEITDADEMIRLGFSMVPVLEVNGRRLEYPKAVAWVNEQEVGQ